MFASNGASGPRVRSGYRPAASRKDTMAAQTKSEFPTWMVVAAIVILAIPVIWALSLVFDVVAAMSIGGILVVVALVLLFIWLKRRVDARR